MSTQTSKWERTNFRYQKTGENRCSRREPRPARRVCQPSQQHRRWKTAPAQAHHLRLRTPLPPDLAVHLSHESRTPSLRIIRDRTIAHLLHQSGHRFGAISECERASARISKPIEAAIRCRRTVFTGCGVTAQVLKSARWDYRFFHAPSPAGSMSTGPAKSGTVWPEFWFPLNLSD